MAKSKLEPIKRPSITDVANLAGVSASAVSKVMRDAYGVSPLMRAKVEDAIKKLGYRPRAGARALRGQSHVIGVSIPQMGNEFFTQIISGIQNRLEDTSYSVLIAAPRPSEHGKAGINALIDHQVDGIIAIAPDVSPVDLTQISRYTPLVMLGRHDLTNDYDTVLGDDTGGAQTVMDHLFDLGHRDICMITVQPDWDEPTSLQPPTKRRMQYEIAMRSRGLEPWVEFCAQENAYQTAMNVLTGDHRPTAILAGYDMLAIEVMKAASELGIARESLSVVGYDDISMAGHPLISLTTVRQFGEQMGKKSAELLMERIEEGRDHANQIVISPKLIIRGSTTSPRITN